MPEFGKTLVIIGLLVAGAGVLLMLGDRLPFKPGRLPGDITWQGKNTTFHFPLMTSILLSVLLSLALWFFNRR